MFVSVTVGATFMASVVFGSDKSAPYKLFFIFLPNFPTP